MQKSYQTDDCLELLGSVTENNDTYMFTFLQSNHVGSTPPEVTMIRPIWMNCLCLQLKGLRQDKGMNDWSYIFHVLLEKKGCLLKCLYPVT